MSSRVIVDWQFPEPKIYAAFPRLRPRVDFHESRTFSLQNWILLLRKSSSRAAFLRDGRRLKVEHTLEFFEKYGREYGDTYIAAGREWVRDGRRTFEANRPADLMIRVGVSPEASYAEFVNALLGTEYERKIALAGVVKGICDAQGFDEDIWDGDLAKSYDGSIDQYLLGSSWWHFKQALGRGPGRNDALDLSHLLYLTPGSYLVTADKSLAECARHAGVTVLSPDVRTLGA